MQSPLSGAFPQAVISPLARFLSLITVVTLLILHVSPKALSQTPMNPMQIFVVDNPGDAPADSVPVFFPRTLRSAIQCANFTPTLDEIQFIAIGTIRPASALPNISQPIIFNGRIGTAKTVLDGSLIPPPPQGFSYLGLAVIGGASSVTDVEIKNFPSGGILLRGNNNTIRRCEIHDNGRPTTSGPGINVVSSSNNTIAQNTICGNNAEGINLLASSNSNRIDSNLVGTPDGVSRSANAAGIVIETRNNTIRYNVISGNNGSGITLFRGGGDTSKFNLIAFNKIGANAAGLSPLTNDGYGIQGLASRGDTVRSNLISGNTLDGIALSQPVGDMLIADNLVGIDRFGEIAMPNRSGINSSGSNIVISNNTISGNISEGIVLQNYGRATIKGNKVGADSSASFEVGNGTVGIAIRSSSNHIIGGLLPGERNIISGNVGSGVEINGLTTSGNIVEGNYIGTDLVGTEEIPNYDGVNITQGAFNNTIQSNLISGNYASGILITPRYRQVPHDNLIIKNLIGTSVNGLAPLPNYTGIEILNGRNTRVGSGIMGEGNVISANLLDGVLIMGDTATGNVLTGNFVGLSANGQGLLGNGNAGVNVRNAANNGIGDNLAQQANYIGGNLGPGVVLFGARTTGNIVTNNSIGVAFGGVQAPNNNGIVIDSAQGNFIGSGPIGAPQNTIMNNGGDGIRVLTTARRNFIRFNSIYRNFDLGIDLDGNGVTMNDSLDTDTGANGLQNYPRLLFATSGANPRVYGVLQSMPLAQFDIDIYRNTISDISNYGEGEEFLTTTTVTTDALGNARFLIAIPVVGLNDKITATATDSNNCTSEFARCIPITVPGPYADLAVTVTDSADTVDLADTLLYRLRVFNDGPEMATDVVVTDTLPPNVTYLADSTTHGMCTYSNGVLTCTIPALLPFEEARIRVYAVADSNGMAVTRVRVVSGTVDYNPVNDTDFDTTYISVISGVGEGYGIPSEFHLSQNYPNPFNPSTTIAYSLPRAVLVTLKVYDVVGREVATLVSETKEAGEYAVRFDAAQLSSGVYFYVLHAGDFTSVRKLLLLR